MAAALAALALSTGCGTLFNGTRQEITIHSIPPGASAVVMPEGIAITTPATLDLRREHDHAVWVELPGYEGRYGFIDRISSGWTLGSFLLLGLGVPIDFWSGGAYQLTPETLYVTLEEAPAPEAAPDSPAPPADAQPAARLAPSGPGTR